jgi:ATP-binding cassette subfamily B protein
MQPFNEVSDVISEISFALASFKRIDEVVTAKKDCNEGVKQLDKPLTTIEGKNVVFSYDSSREIIKGINLKASQGQKVALVGPTGCGKTTLINLIMRFYDPQKGHLYADGTPIQELEKKSYRSHLGMVLQESWIFAGTVYENIAYAKEGASKEEVIEVAKKAQAHDFIERLPQGYDTYITDASGLSLGERQLIAVARVMLLSPEVVLLDEATSSIDVRTESLLSSSFDALMKGKLSFVVAHRLSTIVGSSLILVMKDGEIIESGTHQELMSKHGFYYELYNSQFAKY